MLPGASQILYFKYMMYNFFLGLDLYDTDPAPHLWTAGQDPDDLDMISVMSDVWQVDNTALVTFEVD